ncbi:hypothetical protein HDU76_008881 [Blyttiomyces sp. JEL0837]|nr:hypothetical protein HDU76_008881 [Blyttiomyces sp. JEL0837]
MENIMNTISTLISDSEFPTKDAWKRISFCQDLIRSFRRAPSKVTKIDEKIKDRFEAIPSSSLTSFERVTPLDRPKMVYLSHRKDCFKEATTLQLAVLLKQDIILFVTYELNSHKE